MSWDHREEVCVCTAGSLAAALGLTVLLGWYAHILPLLRLNPAFVAMAYNTALGFLTCGLGLLAALRRPSGHSQRLVLALGGFAVLLGMLTLSEYLFDVSLGIDQLLMRAYVRSGVTAPGRMALCTALCFSLVGASLVLTAIRSFPLRSVLIAVAGSLVAGFGLIALSGYFTGIFPSYLWGYLTRMAFHTALGFLILGGGLIALAWRDEAGHDSLPRWLPLCVGIGAAAATLCFWQALVVQEAAQSDLIRHLTVRETPGRSLNGLPALLPLEALAGGLLLAILLAWTVWLAQTARLRAEELREAQEGLETHVAERTAELADANRALKEIAGWQRGFLRDVLASVTEGKLILCANLEDLPVRRGDDLAVPVFLSPQGGLSELRCQTLAAAEACGFSDVRLHDLVTAVNEAGMNAIVHAGDGTAHVCFDSSGTVQVWVEDLGQGITMENLPRAALSRGFTTAGTLGHGLKLMLQTTDRLWLLTGPTGTIVVLEQDREVPEPAWMRL